MSDRAPAADDGRLDVATAQEWLAGSPLAVLLGLTCEEVDVERGRVTLRMPLLPQLERAAGTGQFHGGAVASLIDTAGDFAVATVVGAGVPTINFRVDYLRPSTGPFLLAHATVRRSGRTVAVADVDVLDDAGRLTAVGRGCYSANPG
ncbi:PaaI family thioesterase [Nocardioides sp. LHG3406-4]|uniref:PaaI family thioesterase n=1 Tax=Nocardioides sp. LHG3406-4 TaxID=2804575 RepID=UPI003CE9E66F